MRSSKVKERIKAEEKVLAKTEKPVIDTIKKDAEVVAAKPKKKIRHKSNKNSKVPVQKKPLEVPESSLLLGGVSIEYETGSMQYRARRGIQYVPPHEMLIQCYILAGVSLVHIDSQMAQVQYPSLGIDYYRTVEKVLFDTDEIKKAVLYNRGLYRKLLTNKKVVRRDLIKKLKIPEILGKYMPGSAYIEIMKALYAVRGIPKMHGFRFCDARNLIGFLSLIEERQFVECAMLSRLPLANIQAMYRELYPHAIKMHGRLLTSYYGYCWQYTGTRRGRGVYSDEDIRKFIANCQLEEIKHYDPHTMLLGRTAEETLTYFGVSNRDTRRIMNQKMLGRIKISLQEDIKGNKKKLSWSWVELYKFIDGQLYEIEKEIEEEKFKDFKEQLEGIKKRFLYHGNIPYPYQDINQEIDLSGKTINKEEEMVQDQPYIQK